MPTKLPKLLLLSALMAFVPACDTDQPTSPRGNSAQSTDPAFSVSEHPDAANTTIVLVHGAWADATGWQEIIPLLQKEGYKVVAVQNALHSLANDIETTKRVIDAETATRSVIAVAHSYGGTVLTGAAAGNAGVKALVFIAAFTPDAGEPFGAFLGTYPTPLGTALVPDNAGFVYLDTEKFRAVFAADVAARVTRVMAVTQKPLFGGILAQAPAAAAWRTIPSWYLVTQEDQAIHPELERFYARRMNAHIAEIASSHVPFISRPHEVTRFILEAANAVSR